MVNKYIKNNDTLYSMFKIYLTIFPNSNMLILRLNSKYKYSIDISLLILKKILKNV